MSVLRRRLAHELRPRGLWLSRHVEIGEFADLVHLHRGPLVAGFAPSRSEPVDQLLAFAAGCRGWRVVVDDRSLLPL